MLYSSTTSRRTRIGLRWVWHGCAILLLVRVLLLVLILLLVLVLVHQISGSHLSVAVTARLQFIRMMRQRCHHHHLYG